MASDAFDGIIPEMKYFIYRNCTPNWSIEKSTINFVDITYIIEGRACYIINDVPYEVGKGDLICIPKKSVRHAKTDLASPMTAYASNVWLFDLDRKEVTLPFPIHSRIGLHEDLLSLYHELNLEWKHKRPGYSLKVRALFLNILYKYFSILYYEDPVEEMNIHIRKALKHIHNFYDSQIEVKTLAGIADLNPSYFGTLFKKYTGSSVREYINRIRIDHAEDMLAGGELSINEAAHKCGFEDYFYFSKVFKKVKGYAPSKVKLIH
jgi:AraC-like DNA-binding protein